MIDGAQSLLPTRRTRGRTGLENRDNIKRLSDNRSSVTVTTDAANAVVYCQYINYPASCVVRPGVVLRPRIVAPVVVRPVVAPVRRGVVVVR